VGEGEAIHQDGPVEEIVPGSGHSGTGGEEIEAVLHTRAGQREQAGEGASLKQ
jgi:hypothetical protein